MGEPRCDHHVCGKKKKSGKGLAVTVGATSASIQCGPRPHSHYFLL